jgi:hypothetical protein
MFACKALLMTFAAAAAVAAAGTGEGNSLAVSVEVRNSSQIAAAKDSSTTARPPTATSAPAATPCPVIKYFDMTPAVVVLAGLVYFFQIVIWLCRLSSRVGIILGVGGKCGDLPAVFFPYDMFTWEVRRIETKVKSWQLARADKVKEDFTYGRLRRRDGDGDADTVDTIL